MARSGDAVFQGSIRVREHQYLRVAVGRVMGRSDVQVQSQRLGTVIFAWRGLLFHRDQRMLCHQAGGGLGSDEIPEEGRGLWAS